MPGPGSEREAVRRYVVAARQAERKICRQRRIVREPREGGHMVIKWRMASGSVVSERWRDGAEGVNKACAVSGEARERRRRGVSETGERQRRRYGRQEGRSEEIERRMG